MPGTPGRSPGKIALFCQCFYTKLQDMPGTPAGRPGVLFVPPGVPRISLEFMCLFFP